MDNDDMEHFDPAMLETLFKQYFETMDMSQADIIMTLNNFEKVSYDDKNHWIEYMIKTVYGFVNSWEKAYNDFNGIWEMCIVKAWENDGVYPAMVPEDKCLLN